MGLDGAAVDVGGDPSADCDKTTLLRLRDMIAASLRLRGLTADQVGTVLNITERHANRICRSVPDWQARRCGEIISGIIGDAVG